MPARQKSTHRAAPVAVLFTVQTPERSDGHVRASLDELDHLLRGLGAVPKGRLVQRQKQPVGAQVFGSGKLEELSALLQDAKDSQVGSDDAKVLLVYDGELSPGQQRHLARHFDVEVLDRTQVILRIFTARARTKTAQLEIEAASLRYETSRIIDDDALVDRQGGGGGRGGKGNTSVQLRKQELRKRLAEIRIELEQAERAAAARRERRVDTPTVALVGYTNAGKSSFMRALTGSEVLVQDALFATLDTTLRKLHPPAKPGVVVADTVGFLRDLPNHLLASFGSTLREALDAQLLLLVVDGSDEEWPAHLQTTLSVLEQVGAGEVPRLVVANKLDRMDEAARERIVSELPDALLVSSRNPADVEHVHRAIVSFFEARLSEAKLCVPFHLAALRAEILSEARVLEETFDEQGAFLTVRAEPAALARWQARLGP